MTQAFTTPTLSLLAPPPSLSLPFILPTSQLIHYRAAKKAGGAVTQLFPEAGNMGKVLPEYLCKWTTNKVRNEGVQVQPETYVKSAVHTPGGKLKLELNTGKTVSKQHHITSLLSGAVG